MKSFAALAVIVLGAAACQRGDGNAAGAPPSGYRDDIAKLCDVLARSGADKLPPSDRTIAIAQWLGANLTAPESHDFLVRIGPLQGKAKADALEAEANRVGLPSCALAAEWRAPNAVAPM